MAITDTLRECRTILERRYVSQFKGLILYGSTARDEASPASDIDLLVLLSRPFDYLQELRQIVDLLYTVQLGTRKDTDKCIKMNG